MSHDYYCDCDCQEPPVQYERRSAARYWTNGLREEFLRLLTQDSESRDRRRKGFNLAIFDAERGYSIWTSVDLGMVMRKYDQAVRNLDQKK